MNDLDRQVRDWFRARAEALGCTVTVDTMGAMFARRGGRHGVAPIAIGSHLDTQPTGGKFDGVLGVLGALEALRTLRRGRLRDIRADRGGQLDQRGGRALRPAMVSSGVFGGAFDPAWAASRQDRAGVSFGDALAAIGYRGTQDAASIRCRPISSCISSRGRCSKLEGKDIGIVTGIQGIRWFEVTVRGEDRHSGTTPMRLRKNALLGAARLVERVNDIALHYAPLAVGTVGLLEVKPNSPNVVPGEVFFTVDQRHPDAAVLDAMEQALVAAAFEASDKLGLEVEVRKILDQPPVRFDADCVACVRDGAAAAGFTAREIVSGAGHDAGYVSTVAPSAMVFVPCRDGISHNEAEFTSKEQCAAGAQVLLQAVLDFDRLLAERHGSTAPR